jgi:hypothetical protein
LGYFFINSCFTTTADDTAFLNVLRKPLLLAFVRFEVFTAVTVKKGVFWDVRRVALLRTDVSEELNASFITVTQRQRASVASYS